MYTQLSTLWGLDFVWSGHCLYHSGFALVKESHGRWTSVISRIHSTLQNYLEEQFHWAQKRTDVLEIWNSKQNVQASKCVFDTYFTPNVGLLQPLFSPMMILVLHKRVTISKSDTLCAKSKTFCLSGCFETKQWTSFIPPFIPNYFFVH